MFKYTHHDAVQGIFESNREDSWIQAFTWYVSLLIGLLLVYITTPSNTI